MIRLASRRPVAEETRRNLGLQAGSAEMVENLEIRQVPGTTFIDLTYRGTDRKKATQSLLALGELARWTGRVPARLGGWLVGIGAVVILLAPVSGGWSAPSEWWPCSRHALAARTPLGRFPEPPGADP